MTLHRYLPAARKIKALGAELSSFGSIGAALYVTLLPLLLFHDLLLEM